MIRLLGDLLSQVMFLALMLALAFCLAYFGVALCLWAIDKIQGLLK